MLPSKLGVDYSPSPLDLARAFGRDNRRFSRSGSAWEKPRQRSRRRCRTATFWRWMCTRPASARCSADRSGEALQRPRDAPRRGRGGVELIARGSPAYTCSSDPWPKKRSPRLLSPSSSASRRGSPTVATSRRDRLGRVRHRDPGDAGAETSLANTVSGFAPRPDYRPLTKFERRGLARGHGVWDGVRRR